MSALELLEAFNKALSIVNALTPEVQAILHSAGDRQTLDDIQLAEHTKEKIQRIDQEIAQLRSSLASQ